MAFFGRQFSASPVLTLPPHPSHQTQFAMGGFAPQHAPHQSFGAGSFQNPPQTALPRFAPSAGRKRSRDEASVNLEPEAPPPVQESEDDWTYGEGMVLIKPGAKYVADAGTQSGTWLEEQAVIDEEDRNRRQAEQPDQRSHKSQRTDSSLDHGLPAPPQASNPSPLPAFIPNPSEKAAGGPVIDDFTLQLGIGWRRISDDEHIQAAARGWARFIENHYPLTRVNIRLESKGLQSYLVEASEGFFLFAETLRQGQLLSPTVDGALRNLQSTPPTFDGTEVLLAAESPRLTPELQRDVDPLDMDMKMD